MSDENVLRVDQREPWQKKPKFSWKTVIIISFGFFASSIAWSQYNSQVNQNLESLIGSRYFIIGFIMTIDNIIGMFLQPYTGNLSDRTKSKYGRRMPYIMIGLPFSAAFFITLEFSKNFLWLYIINILIFVTIMAVWRAPVVSLMPDFVDPKHRSKGNAVVNMFGGVASAIAGFVGGWLIKTYEDIWGYIFVGGFMLISLVVLLLGVKEPDTRKWDFTEALNKEKEKGVLKKIKEISQEKEKSPIWMLIAIWGWFMTHQAIESLLTLYTKNVLGIEQGGGQMLLIIVSGSFIVFAFVSSFLAKKITRKLTILIGLGICTASLIAAIFIKGPQHLWILYTILATYGAGWAFININSIAMMWSMATTPKQIGTYTGLYYFASFLAAVLGPITLGYTMEYAFQASLEYLFPVAAIFMVISIIAMLFVKRGEPDLTEEEKLEIERAKVEAK